MSDSAKARLKATVAAILETRNEALGVLWSNARFAEECASAERLVDAVNLASALDAVTNEEATMLANRLATAWCSLRDGDALAVAWIAGPLDVPCGARVRLEVESTLLGLDDTLWMGPGLDEGPARSVEFTAPDAPGRVEIRARVRGRAGERREIVVATHIVEVVAEA